jgi:hypothetical protein
MLDLPGRRAEPLPPPRGSRASLMCDYRVSPELPFQARGGVGLSTSTVSLRAFPYIDSDHCISICGDAVLSFSLKPPTPRFLEAWSRTMAEVVARSNASVVVLIIIDGNARPPDDAAKKAIAQTVTRHGKRIRALAYVIEGQGFAAAAVRSAVSLISLLARYPFPQRAFKRTDEAAAWAVRQMTAGSAASLDVTAIAAQAEAMRTELKRQFAAAG